MRFLLKPKITNSYRNSSRLLHNGVATSAIALTFLGISSTAQAQNECGIAPVGGGAVTCDTDGNPYSDGIIYASPVDDLAITLDEGVVIDTSGNANGGVNVAGGGDAAIAVNGDTDTSITTDAAGAFGVLAATSDGELTVMLDEVTTSGLGADAIRATSTGGDVMVTSRNVSTEGDGATAVWATSSGGDVTVETTGAVVANGADAGGIYAVSDTGNVAVTANDVTTVAADDANADSGRAAIYALGANAAVNVTGTASTAGTGFGGADSATIMAIATDGDASANIAGASASGDGVSAVLLDASNDATATLTGEIAATGAGADAVVLNADNIASVTVGTDATVTAADGDGIVLNGASGNTLTNLGTIGNNNAGFAVVATGGPLQIINSGTLASNIGFTAGDDVVNNAGTFVVGATTDFGGGANVFNNSGTVRFADGATAPVARVFSGLGTFNNTGGMIDMRNGVAGDTLTLPGAFVGSGDSRVGFDVNLSDTTTADRLVIEGAATGSTGVLLNFTGEGRLNSQVVLIEAGDGTEAGAFSLAGGAQTLGLIEAGLVFDAENNEFAVVGAPGAGVYRAAGFLDAARNLWYESADAWSAHMRELRDGAWASGAESSGGGLWIQMHGSRDRREDTLAVNNFGLARDYDLGFDQDYFGGQAGFDFGGGIGADGNFAFGVTGGYVNSSVGYAGVADRLSFDAFNGGVYAMANSGIIFLNVLGKYDYYLARSESQVSQYNEKFRGDSYGAQGEIGLRLGGDNFFIEPVATVAWVRTNLNDLTVGNSAIEFRGDDGLRGKAGARIGARLGEMGGNAIMAYAGGNFVREFKAEDTIDFTNSGQTINAFNRPRGDYGEGVVGLNIGASNMASGFIEANGAKGDQFEAFGARGGLRIRF
jgi:outer membrane autotransporter protein